MLIVEKSFQKRILFRLLLLSLFGVILMSCIIYLLANENMERTFFSIHQGVRSTWQALFPAIFIGGSLTLLVSTVTVFYVTLYQSHKIGGPIYRFKQVMEKLNEGHLNETVTLREGDYMSDLAESLNSAIHVTRDKIFKLKKEAMLLDDAMKDTISETNSPIDTLRDLKVKIKNINKILDSFTVE